MEKVVENLIWELTEIKQSMTRKIREEAKERGETSNDYWIGYSTAEEDVMNNLEEALKVAFKNIG